MIMATQREIAKEYGMSFESVVRLYARNGHSMTDTARIIGMSVAHFIKICRRNAWDDMFVSGQKSVARKQADRDRQGVCTPAQLANAERMRKAREYKKITYQGVEDTIAGHCRRIGCSYRNAISRLHRHPGDYDYAFSKLTGRRVRYDTARHIWRQQR